VLSKPFGTLDGDPTVDAILSLKLYRIFQPTSIACIDLHLRLDLHLKVQEACLHLSLTCILVVFHYCISENVTPSMNMLLMLV
jgi:hypothetical protein